MITLTPEQQQDVARRFQGLATRWIATAHVTARTRKPCETTRSIVESIE
jgi:hypothetical protein